MMMVAFVHNSRSRSLSRPFIIYLNQFFFSRMRLNAGDIVQTFEIVVGHWFKRFTKKTARW